MNHYPEKVKEKLLSILKTMSENHWLFSKNPGHDFMRQDSSKLSFYDTMKLIISMGKGCMDEEIIQYFDMDFDRIPSQSAFNQRRSQISLDAFHTLFQEFSTSFPSTTINLKVIVFLQQMVHIRFILLIHRFLKTTINLILKNIVAIIICI